MKKVFNLSPVVFQSQKPKPKWLNYLNKWILGNSVIWGAVGIYLLFPPIYTSEWGLMILGPNPGPQLNLPDVGTATSDSSTSPRPSVYQDARNDYVYLANSPDILAKAAQLMDMTVDDFGEPTITTDPNTAIIAFEITGTTPEEAVKKSKIFYQVLSEAIEQIKQEEIRRRERETQSVLETAQKKLNVSKDKLLTYQNQTLLSSEEQIQQVATNLEELRGKKAELVSQERALERRLQQLSADVNFSDQASYDAYILQADNVYQTQFQNYGQLKAELAILASKFEAEHPEIIEKKAQLDDTLNFLQIRASSLLGRSITPEESVRLAALVLDPKLKAIREELFQEIVTNRAEQQASKVEIVELDKQINQLDNRLKILSEEKSRLETLNADLDVAQAIFTATVAKLDLSKGNIDSIYPPVQLVAGPNLPDKDKPTFPDLTIGLILGGAGTVLMTTGIVLLWWEGKNSWKLFSEKSLSQDEE